MSVAELCLDGARWGPASQCRSLDLTPVFENTVLAVLPCAVLLVLVAAVRLPRAALKHATPSRLTRSDALGAAQLAASALALIASVILLGCAARDLSPVQRGRAMGGSSLIAAQAMQVAGSVALVAAIAIERRRTLGGIVLVPFFLLCTILFDGARLRTYTALPVELGIKNTAFYAVFIVQLAVHTVLFGLISINLTRSEPEAAFVDRLGFLWLSPLLFKGSRKLLTMENIPPLGARFQPRTLGLRLRQVYRYGDMSRGKIPRQNLFIGGLLRGFLYNLVTPIVPKLVVTAITLCQPYLIRDTITFIESYAGTPGAVPQPANKGWSLAGAYALVYTVKALASAQYLYATKQNEVVLSGAVLEAVYDKATRLDLTAASELGSAQAVNMMSQDLERIQKLIDPIHEVWSGLAIIGVSLYILWDAARLLFLAVFGFLLLSFVLAPFAAAPMEDAQDKWSEASDHRIKVTTSVFSSIRAVKMSGLEPFFRRKLLTLRNVELDRFRIFGLRLTQVVCVTHLMGASMPAFGILCLAGLAHAYPHSKAYSFAPATVFQVLNTINIMIDPMSDLGEKIGDLAAALAAVKRVEKYLLMAEKEAEEPGAKASADSGSAVPLTSLRTQRSDPSLTDANIGWKAGGEPILCDVSLQLPPGLTMVMGRLSTGKSTLLNAFLGEAKILTGTSLHLPRSVEGEGIVGYAPQEAWTQETATIRANIVFYNPMGFEPEWYNCVIEACALKPDLAKFEQGDQRLAKGLSGGQKQRVNLARAVYARQAAMYILDDPLSAVDAKTEAHIWTHLFGPDGLLYQRRVLLASNSVFRIRDADRIVRLVDGHARTITSVEASEALAQDSITIRDQKKLHLYTTTAGSGASVRFPANDMAHIEEASRGVTPAGSPTRSLVNTAADILQDVENTTMEATDEEHNKMDDVHEGHVSWSNILYWVAAARPWRVAVLMLLLSSLAMSPAAYQLYTQHWTNQAQPTEDATYRRMVGGFIGLWAALFTASVYCVYFIVIDIAIPANRAMHERLLSSVLAAPMSFFSAHSSGQLIARFSHDLFVAIFEWSFAVFGLVLSVVMLLSSCIIMMVAAPFTTLTFVVAVGFSASIRYVYLPGSRQMRRFQMAARSPLYNLMADSTTGLSVIRAFNAVEPMRSKNTEYATNLQRATYALYASQQWLQTWLEMAAMLMNFTLIAVVVGRRHDRSMQNLGVALTQTVSLSGMVTRVVTEITDAEVVSIVFERLRDFSNILPEESTATRQATSGWSSQGSAFSIGHRAGIEVAFHNVSLAYDEGNEVLHDVSFTVPAGFRFGVCGRTGSGKSTLLNALLCLQNISSGSITLNGVDICGLSLGALRNMMTVVAQEPFLVDGLTVRENLLLGDAGLDTGLRSDSSDSSGGDDDIWALLKETGLASKMLKLDRKLATPMEEAGLSLGESQILSVTRALLSDRPVVLLDEVTSSLDRESDAQIQRLLQAHAHNGKTVVAIAHRIEDIIDCDLVLVLEEGRVRELGPPSQLLARRNGAFRQLASLQGIDVDHRHEIC